MRYNYIETVEAMYVTDDTFDGSHPNPDHMTGLMFDPVERTVTLDSPCDVDESVATIGDVIVRHASRGSSWTWDSIWKVEAFENTFTPVIDPCQHEPRTYQGWGDESFCIHCGDPLPSSFIEDAGR